MLNFIVVSPKKQRESKSKRITSLTNYSVARKGPESTQTDIETPAGGWGVIGN
jgi:hypothetical protein